MSDSEAPKKGFGYYFKKVFLHIGDLAGYEKAADTGYINGNLAAPEGIMKTPEPTSGPKNSDGTDQISPDVKQPKGFTVV